MTSLIQLPAALIDEDCYAELAMDAEGQIWLEVRQHWLPGKDLLVGCFDVADLAEAKRKAMNLTIFDLDDIAE